MALQQIRDKQYQLPWALDEREVIGVGLNFSTTSRRPDGWKWEKMENVVPNDPLKMQDDPLNSKSDPLKIQNDPPKNAQIIERRRQIEILMKENSSISKEDMAGKLSVSPSTIKREMKELGYKWVGHSTKGYWKKYFDQ